jgi:hypothetical protein
LYTEPFKRPYVKVDVGGRGVILNSWQWLFFREKK